MKTKANDHNADLLEIFTGMAQVTRCCRQDVAFCEGVTFHQFMILDAVAKAKGIYMADLHKLLSVEKSTTTRLVEPLVKKGLVRREKADFDSRAVKLTLTVEGKSIHKRVMKCLTDFLNRVLGNIEADKRKDVLESVRIFIEAIRCSATGCNCR
jgi:DNA-binding MarR family transcriptional regulator